MIHFIIEKVMRLIILVLLALMISVPSLYAQEVTCEDYDFSQHAMNCFINGQVANADEINANFKTLIEFFDLRSAHSK